MQEEWKEANLPRRQKKGNSSMLFRSASRGTKGPAGRASKEERPTGLARGRGAGDGLRAREEIWLRVGHAAKSRRCRGNEEKRKACGEGPSREKGKNRPWACAGEKGQQEGAARARATRKGAGSLERAAGLGLQCA